MATGSDFASVIFGLTSAATWGVGDFSGGMATRRAPVRTVVIMSYTIGLVAVILLALVTREAAPALTDVLWGAGAGIFGQIGLFALYRAMAVGQMGIVAPVTAVLAASLPVIVGAITQGLPSAIHLIGFVLALVGVFFISRPEGSAGKPTGLGYAFIGGLGFGAFFILIAQVRDNSVFWPLAAARAASVILMLAVVLVSRRFDRPDRRALNWILLSGVMDVCGNIFFVLAEQTGRLDIAGVLSSLYPATTVLLALVVLRDRLTRVQTIGVVLAMAAIPLIASR